MITLSFPPIPSPRPLELSKIANKVKAELRGIPTVDSVLARIAQNESHLITYLEWFCCVQGKLEWDKSQLADVANETSLELWKAAKEEKWLRNYLLKVLVLNATFEAQIANSLIKAFFLVNDILFINNKLVQIVSSIVSNNKFQIDHHFVGSSTHYQPDIFDSIASNSKHFRNYQLVIISNEYDLTKHKILDLIGQELNVWEIDFPHFVDDVVRYFKDNALKSVKSLEPWLLSCLKEELPEQQGEAVSNILVSVPKEAASKFPKLVAWLKQNYGSGEKANHITQEAKQKLREWIGAINYGDFASLVNLLLSNLSGIPDYQRNQLEKRMYFWGNYSDRFEQIRIFIPSSSRYAISNSLASDITILQDDNISEPTEICAFDFGTHIVVEFFRGTGSETRLFDCRTNPNIRETLFQSNHLTTCRIRKLGGQTHDHVFLWQYYCERWLAKQNIFPNPNIRRFKSSHNLDYPYDPISGMPSIEYNKKLKRDRNLVKWKEDMYRIETILRNCK